MSKPEALLFDVDGTLANTERDGHRIAFNLAFKEAGLNWQWDAVLYGDLLSVTGGKERMLYFIQQHDPALPETPHLQALVADLHRAKTEHYLGLLKKGGIPLRPGVARLLREARERGVKLAIATTTTKENVICLLETTLGTDAPGWFEVIAAGDMVQQKKPAPDVFLLALERLGLPASDCIAFEDSINGLRSSLAAGLKTIVTVNDYTAHEDFSGAELILDCLGDPQRSAKVLDGKMDSTYLDLDGLARLLNEST